MIREQYSYHFEPAADMKTVEDLLLLATMAAEGLHGRARIQLDATFRCEPAAHMATIDASNEVGAAIARIFTALLSTTIGEMAFKVDRVNKEVQV
jgi:hypothetical protein